MKNIKYFNFAIDNNDSYPSSVNILPIYHILIQKKKKHSFFFASLNGFSIKYFIHW